MMAVGLVPLLLFQLTTIFRPIALGDMYKYVGQSRKVVITVTRTFKHDTKGVYLYPVGASDFSVLLPLANLGRFPKNPELVYANKTLRVVGKIYQEGKTFVMIVPSRDQVEEVR